MVKNSSKQVGSVHVILVVALIILVVGALGFVLWNNFLNTKTSTANSLNEKVSQTATPNDIKPKAHVINIHELGISITVPDSIKDLTYTYKSDGAPTRVGGSNIVVGSVSFSTASLTNKYPECSSDKANPLGSLTKVTGTYGDGVLGPTSGYGGMVKQFSDSFLTFVGPQYACYFNVAGNDTTLGASMTSQMNDLSTSIKETVTQYTLKDAVKDINTTLATTVCSGKASVNEGDFVQVADTDPFEYRGGKSLINQEFDYAYVQYGCGSQGSIALMKRTGADWRIISRDARIYPTCDAIHGESFPTAIVDKCYETDRSAEPTDIQ